MTSLYLFFSSSEEREGCEEAGAAAATCSGVGGQWFHRWTGSASCVGGAEEHCLQKR